MSLTANAYKEKIWRGIEPLEPYLPEPATSSSSRYASGGQFELVATRVEIAERFLASMPNAVEASGAQCQAVRQAIEALEDSIRQAAQRLGDLAAALEERKRTLEFRVPPPGDPRR